MKVYALIMVIVPANAGQNASVGNDTTLIGGIIAGATLLLLNRVMTFVLARSPKAEHLMVGEPLVLVDHGRLVAQTMQKEGITEDQIMQALREHEISDLRQARLCVLEADGTISVVPLDSRVHRTRRHFRGLRVG